MDQTGNRCPTPATILSVATSTWLYLIGKQTGNVVQLHPREKEEADMGESQPVSTTPCKIKSAPLTPHHSKVEQVCTTANEQDFF